MAAASRGQLRLADRPRDGDLPLERFDVPEPLPLLAPRVRVDWRFPLDFDEPPPFEAEPLLLFERDDRFELERDEDPERAFADLAVGLRAGAALETPGAIAGQLLVFVLVLRLVLVLVLVLVLGRLRLVGSSSMSE